MSEPNRSHSTGETVAAVGEFGLIERLTALLPPGLVPPGASVPLSVGDDAAALQVGVETLLATTDALLEGVHFRRETASAEDIGWKALAVNLSDIAAMGGQPLCALLTLGLPKETPVAWAEGVYRGLAAMSQQAACPLVGGDTVTSPDRIYLSLTVLGTAPEGRVLTRAGARAGDALLVTGTLGDALAGLRALERGWTPESRPFPDDEDQDALARCVRAQRRPLPRLAAGAAALDCGRVHAMMDLSDGVSGDVRRLAERSRVGVRLFAASLPLSPALRRLAALLDMDPVALALAGGEEYELLLAAPPEAVPEVAARLQAAGSPFTVVGEVTEDPAERALVQPDGEVVPLPRVSWDQFTSSPLPPPPANPAA